MTADDLSLRIDSRAPLGYVKVEWFLSVTRLPVVAGIVIRDEAGKTIGRAPFMRPALSDLAGSGQQIPCELSVGRHRIVVGFVSDRVLAFNTSATINEILDLSTSETVTVNVTDKWP